MASDQIDPADLTKRVDRVPSDGDVVERLQQLSAAPQDKTPSPFLHAGLERIDRFEIIRMLGQGGMGRVYLALDTKLDRKVAIKVPLFDSGTDPTIMQRFRREGQAAGAVSHPNVVATHEVGDVDQGCYIVSEYIEGPTLREYLRRRGTPLKPRVAAQLILAIASGVRAAHSQLVIHRDIKPSNILMERLQPKSSSSSADPSIVTIDDDLFRPRVTDFGLAGFADHRTAITISGALVGTPSYMAPEQVDGAPLGPQADIFSLGVMLYELMTGRSPFSSESYVATIERIQHYDPPALRTTNSAIPRDLSAISECAISKEPLRRYSNAGELADDLQRFLDGTPVRARSLGAVGRFGRWVRRHPAQAALTCVICVALLTSLIQNRLLQKSLNRSDELKKNLAGTAGELTDANAKYRETVYVQDMSFAFDAWDRNAMDDVKSLLARYAPTESESDHRGIEWYLLSSVIETKPPREFPGHEGEVYDIVVAPDQKSFFSVGEDGTRRYWEIESGKAIRVSEPQRLGRSHAIALSPDGKTFYSGGNSLRSRSVLDGSLVQQKPLTSHAYGIRAIAVSPDNHYVASLCLQHQIHINSIGSDPPYAKKDIAVPSQRCTRIDFSPNGKQLYFSKEMEHTTASVSRDRWNEFVVWDIESEHELFSGKQLNNKYFGPVDASHDGRLVAVGASRKVQLFDVADLEFTKQIPIIGGFVIDVEFSADDRLIACGIRDGSLEVVDTNQTGSRGHANSSVHVSHPYRDPINTVAWVDDHSILTGDDAGRILLHQLTPGFEPIRTFDAHTCRLQPDGRHLVTINRLGDAEVIDLVTQQPVCQLTGLSAEIPIRVLIDPTKRWLAITYDNRLQIWNLRDEMRQCEVVHHPKSLEPSDEQFRIHRVTFSPDGQLVATVGSVDATALIWDTESGDQITEIPLGIGNMGNLVSYSPDGKLLLCAGSRGSFIYHTTTGITTPLGIARIQQAGWISETRLLVSNTDGLLGIFDCTKEKLVMVLGNQSQVATQLAISPDSRSLVTSDRQTVNFWNLPTNRLIGSIPLSARSISFSPDGSKLYLTTRVPEENECELRVISRKE